MNIPTAVRTLRAFLDSVESHPSLMDAGAAECMSTAASSDDEEHAAASLTSSASSSASSSPTDASFIFDHLRTFIARHAPVPRHVAALATSSFSSSLSSSLPVPPSSPIRCLDADAFSLVLDFLNARTLAHVARVDRAHARLIGARAEFAFVALPPHLCRPRTLSAAAAAVPSDLATVTAAPVDIVHIDVDAHVERAAAAQRARLSFGRRLCVGDRCDARDRHGAWFAARIVDANGGGGSVAASPALGPRSIGRGASVISAVPVGAVDGGDAALLAGNAFVRVHFDNYGARWDEFVARADADRFAPLRTHTTRAPEPVVSSTSSSSASASASAFAAASIAHRYHTSPLSYVYSTPASPALSTLGVSAFGATGLPLTAGASAPTSASPSASGAHVSAVAAAAHTLAALTVGGGGGGDAMASSILVIVRNHSAGAPSASASPSIGPVTPAPAITDATADVDVDASVVASAAASSSSSSPLLPSPSLPPLTVSQEASPRWSGAFFGARTHSFSGGGAVTATSTSSTPVLVAAAAAAAAMVAVAASPAPVASAALTALVPPISIGAAATTETMAATTTTTTSSVSAVTGAAAMARAPRPLFAAATVFRPLR